MAAPSNQGSSSGEPASLSRVFLGWRGPFLQRVVGWLFEGEEAAHGDFSRLLLVVPGRRAGRRLLEMMAQQVPAHTPAFVPPAIVTLGNLPESLELDSELTVAGEVDELLARVAVLRSAAVTDIELLCGSRPPEGRLEDWLDLAREVGALEDELAGEDLDLRAVRARVQLEEHDERRFEALASLAVAHEERLRRRGMLTRNRARLAAAAPGDARTVVLVGVADLGRLFRRLLSRSRVVCLIQAPAGEAAAFDDWGCPREEIWAERSLDLPPSGRVAAGVRLQVVDRPAEQIRAVATFVEACCSRHSGEPLFRTHEVAVGVGDPLSARAVAESLAAAGLPAHSAFGRPFARSRAARLLGALGRFVAGRRLADLAALVRHPDVERFLDNGLESTAEDRAAAGRDLVESMEAGDWPSVLDRYLTATLARRLGSEMPEHSPGTPLVSDIGERLRALLPQGRRSLGQWSAPLLDTLTAIYGDLTLALADPGEAELGEALSLLAEALRDQVEGVATDDGELVFDAAQAITFTLGRLSDSSLGGTGGGVGAEGAEGVEILGWLELPLDDAPALVVTGLNEGVIPQSVDADPFLPDRTRRSLGLLHNRRRYSRDLFHLTALVHSREELLLVAGRRSVDDEPLVPSRLLLACAAPDLPARVRSFFVGPSASVASPDSDDPHPRADEGRWRGAPPHPEPLPSAIGELPVTAFRDYLACPYRFYLRHVLRLSTTRDRRRELDPSGFGSLAHEVLRRFGEAASGAIPDEGALEARLGLLLEMVARERFGPAPPPALRVQLEQLRRRLDAFARWQAKEWANGWTVERRYLEVPLRATLEVDGEPFVVTGRIDRIDLHGDGTWRLLDYKTGEQRRTPREVHRAPDGGWIDLQLPLYALLVRKLGLEGRVELGFVHLARELDGPVLSLADWSEEELDQAWEVAREVVRQVRRERFWPPSAPPPYDDGLAWICGDDVARGEGGGK